MARKSGRTRGRRVVVLALVALVVVVGLVVAALVTKTEVDAHKVADPPAQPAVDPVLRPAGPAAPEPVPAALAATLASALGDPAVGSLTGRVLDDETGRVLWESDPDQPRPPASTTKLLTAAAALLAMPPDATVPTTLAVGDDPSTLVVVPGGDVAVARDPKSELFPGSPSIDALADVVTKAGFAPKSIVVDPGPWSGDPMGPGWDPADIAAGNVAPMQAFMLDAGRVNPSDEYSPRTPTPALDAARVLASKLGVPPDAVTVAPLHVATTRQLGVVQSAQLRDRVAAMLEHSDNVQAEAVCRELAQDRDPGSRPSFADGTAAVLATLRDHGVDVGGVQLGDCSGMSPVNRIPASVLAALMRIISKPSTLPGADRKLAPILDGLPIGGATGTLETRFTGTSADGAGWVRAKTGTLSGTSALAGTVTDVDGRALSFAFLSTGTDPSAARPALDRIAAELHDCGCH